MANSPGAVDCQHNISSQTSGHQPAHHDILYVFCFHFLHGREAIYHTMVSRVHERKKADRVVFIRYHSWKGIGLRSFLSSSHIYPAFKSSFNFPLISKTLHFAETWLCSLIFVSGKSFQLESNSCYTFYIKFSTNILNSFIRFFINIFYN